MSRALDALLKQSPNRAFQASFAVAKRNFAVAISLGEDAVTPLASLAMEDRRYRDAKQAIDALTLIGSPAVDALIGILRATKDRYVRAHCAEALGRIGEARAAKPLTEALKSYDPRVSESARDALVALGFKSTEALIQDFGDKPSRLVADILALTKDPQSVVALITGFDRATST